MLRIRFSMLFFFVLILSCRNDIPETNNSVSKTSSNEQSLPSGSFDQNELKLEDASETSRGKSENSDLNNFFHNFIMIFQKLTLM